MRKIQNFDLLRENCVFLGFNRGAGGGARPPELYLKRERIVLCKQNYIIVTINSDMINK
jgi:hypothetical protein